VERFIGPIRQECLAHVLVLHEPHLRRILTCYFAYDHGTRTHLSLEKDAPDERPIERPEVGRVVQMPEVDGLHHPYARHDGMVQHRPAQSLPDGRPDLVPPAATDPPLRFTARRSGGRSSEDAERPASDQPLLSPLGVWGLSREHGSSPGDSDPVLATDRLERVATLVPPL